MADSTKRRPSMISLRLGSSDSSGRPGAGRELVVEVGVTENPKRLALRFGIEKREEGKGE